VFLDDVDEKEQMHRMSAYLYGLRERLRSSIQQHQEVAQSSVQLLKDLGDVANMMQVARTSSPTQVTKIRRLIMGFETVNATQNPAVGFISLPTDVSEIRSLITEFENLNESQLLRESMMSFKHARESLEKVSAFLDSTGRESPRSSPHPSQLIGCPSASRSLREKIEAFNKVLGEGSAKQGDTCRHFTDCFSSRSTVEEEASALGSEKPKIVASKTNSGYEGDVDSEVEVTEVSSGTGVTPEP
ncbi:hypothetical protein KR026_011506, partial [Drosophila bipectinata]